ncbi:DUF6777 domain-containing protein [Streptomyces sp. NPDC053048]|uniref:DUF6777 domain-containing protein n=1 Tax=Streptomyces sp. NPDC053048 TaxID=3365694 RepID=UPI0037D027F2
MSSEPPSGNRPSGPPSGPLSGRGSQPPGRPSEEQEATRQDWTAQPSGPSGPQQPPGPPAPPSGERGTPGERPGGRPPWWRSKAAIAAAAVVVVAVLAIVFFRQGNGGNGEVVLQSAAADGRDPFTQSSAKGGGSTTPAPVEGGSSANRSIPGSKPGLYAGTRNKASCDVERQIGLLNQDQAKARAFAATAGVETGQLASYLRGLTSLNLRYDTRVTNHGFKDGEVSSFQSVLQTGTAVLVDDRGVPRVRCACGNPLKPPVAVKGNPKAKGDTWPDYRSSDVVVVQPADAVMESFVVYDPATKEWFERPVGTDGEDDRAVGAPKGGVPATPTRPAPAPTPQRTTPPAPTRTYTTPMSPPPPPPVDSPPTPPPAYRPPPLSGN